MRADRVNRLCRALGDAPPGCRRVAGTCCATLALLLCGVVSQSAAAGLVQTGSFGGPGSGDGQFELAEAVAVDSASGDVYVVDSDKDRIEKFSPSGEYLLQFGSQGTGGGQFTSQISGVAVDPNDGDVYATDTYGDRVEEFSSTGEYLAQFGSEGSGPGEFSLPYGVAVDASTDDVYVTDSGNNRVEEFNSTGGFVAEFNDNGGLSSPVGIAIDQSDEDIYVTNFNTDTAVEFDAAGDELAQFGGDGSGDGELFEPIGVAVDPDDGDVYVADYGNSRIETFEPSGGYVAQFDSSGSGLVGVAASTGGKVYAVAQAHEEIYILAPAIASTGSAEAVTQTTASLTGVVEPDGADVTYYFEYGTDTSYGERVPVTDADAGSGPAPVPVSETVTGLEPGTVYHYRLAATVEGVTTYGEDASFMTVPASAPTASTGAATAVTQTGSTLTGSVDPEGLPATYYFEYGTSFLYTATAPAQGAEAGSDESEHSLSQALSGLSPDTTYHYRIVASGPGGTAYGDDETFTTLPEAAAATTGAATGVTDAMGVLTGTVDPKGAQASYYFEYGPTSSYGHSAPAPPGAVGAGFAAQTVGQALDGLAPGTTYHYRLVAVNAGGASYGADQTFTTLPASTCEQSQSCSTAGKSTTTAKVLAGVARLGAVADVVAGRATLKLSCTGPSGAVCAGKVTLEAQVKVASGRSGKHSATARTRRIGSASFGIAQGGATTLHVRLTKAGRRLGRRGGARATAIVSQVIPGASTTRRRVKIV